MPLACDGLITAHTEHLNMMKDENNSTKNICG